MHYHLSLETAVQPLQWVKHWRVSLNELVWCLSDLLWKQEVMAQGFCDCNQYVLINSQQLAKYFPVSFLII